LFSILVLNLKVIPVSSVLQKLVFIHELRLKKPQSLSRWTGIEVFEAVCYAINDGL
jgi:hypothetical protein